MKATSIGWLVPALALVVAAAPPAYAREDDEEEEAAQDEEASDEETSDDEEASEEGDDAESSEEEGDGGEDEAEDATPSDPRSWYFGPVLRYTALPAFMLELGLAEAPTVGNATFAVVANHRNPDGASFEIGLGYTGLGFNGPMRAKGDRDEDTEWIDSDLWLLHATASIYWTAGIIDKLSFEYGLGIDFGLMLGDLVRTEAYPSGDGYARCPGIVPPPLPNSTYCASPSVPFDQAGEHYGVVQEDLPPVGGSLMIPHLALRYEPIPEVAVKLEGALGFPMSWLGLSVAYGPEL